MKKAKKTYHVTIQKIEGKNWETGKLMRPVVPGEEIEKGTDKERIEYVCKWVEEAGCWWIIPIENLARAKIASKRLTTLEEIAIEMPPIEIEKDRRCWNALAKALEREEAKEGKRWK